MEAPDFFSWSLRETEEDIKHPETKQLIPKLFAEQARFLHQCLNKPTAGLKHWCITNELYDL